MSFAVALSGRIGAGKSTLAECLAQRLGAPAVGFGSTVRAEAARRSVVSTRESLQELGQSMLESLGAEAFSLLAMREAGVEPSDLPLVIEGVRHVEVYEALSSLVAPGRLHLVYVNTPDQIRSGRLVDNGIEADKIPSIDSHVTERDVATKLRRLADYVVSNTNGDAACEEVTQWLEAKHTDSSDRK